MPSAEYLRLMEKDVRSWSVADVGVWLEAMNLGDYKVKFSLNEISGDVLYEIQEEDLVMLGINSLGHRKRILRGISQLVSEEQRFPSFSDTQSESGSEISDSVSDTGSTRSGMSSASQKSNVYEYGDNDWVQLKLMYKGSASLLSVKAGISLRDLKRKVRKEFRMRMDLQFEDQDGDLVTIKRTKDFKCIIRHHQPPIRLLCKRGYSKRHQKELPTIKGAISDHEKSLLDSLLDATIVIDTKAIILAFNTAAEKLFGYEKHEVVGENVKVLMSESYAKQHDQFVQSYLKTGQSKVVGKTRCVVARHSTGKPLTVELSLTETKTEDRHTFTGTCRPTQEKQGDDAQFSILDSLLEMAVVINERGNILYMNQRACQFLGYTKDEVLGENVKLIMPSPFKENHDHYLNNYRLSGIKKVIDKTRDVLAERKDGSVVRINLSVSEQEDGQGKKFTGLFREAKGVERKSVLSQQREVLHNVLVPAVIIDSTGMIQGFNRSASKLTGYDLSEVLGQNVKILMDSATAAKHDQYLATYMETKQSKILGKERVVLLKLKQGSMIRVKLSVSEFNDGDKSFFTGMFHDAR